MLRSFGSLRLSMLSLMTHYQVIKLVAEETCSIGIPMYVLLVNVYSCRVTRVGFETVKGLPCVAFLVALFSFLWLEGHGG